MQAIGVGRATRGIWRHVITRMRPPHAAYRVGDWVDRGEGEEGALIVRVVRDAAAEQHSHKLATADLLDGGECPRDDGSALNKKCKGQDCDQREHGENAVQVLRVHVLADGLRHHCLGRDRAQREADLTARTQSGESSARVQRACLGRRASPEANVGEQAGGERYGAERDLR